MKEGDTPANPFGPRVASPSEVAAAVTSALTLGYSAPMPGLGSRYSDLTVAHETRLLGVSAIAAAASEAADRRVGEAVLEAVSSAMRSAFSVDLSAAGYLVPLARAALLGERLGKVLAGLSNSDARLFFRAVELAGPSYTGGTLERALSIALGAGRDATLRDAMRFAAAGTPEDAMAREYSRSFEITRELARPALLSALSRGEATRPALVQAYLEVLSEVPDLDVVRKVGRKEAEDVSRMAKGVLKAGGTYSRRGLQTIANFDALLRSGGHLAPTATEPPVLAAAFLLSLEHSPGYLNGRVRPAPGR